MVKQGFNISVVTKENVEVENANDDVGHGRYNLVLLVTCCLITIGAIMDMSGYSLVVPAASCDLNLTLEQGGILKSISCAGCLFAIPWGHIADTSGRKRSIHISVIVGFIFSAMTSFSNSFCEMLVLKFLSSSFSTASLTLITTYLGESTSRNIRNKYIFIQYISCTGSDLVYFGLGYLILSLDFSVPVPYFNTYKPWRLLSLCTSLPLGLGAVMMCFLKESPKFLAYKGETEKAMNVLRTMYKANYGDYSVYPVKSLMSTSNLVDTSSFCSSLSKQTTLIFKPPLLWSTLLLFLILSICCSTNTVLFMWFPTMANSFFTAVSENSSFCQKIVANITPITYKDVCIDNNSFNTIYIGIILSFIFTSLNIAALAFANWRRIFIFICLFLAGISCVTVNMISDPIVSMVLFCIIRCTLLAIGSVYSYYVDIFPTSCRGFATSLGTMVARIFCIGGINIVGTTVINHCQLTFYCWSIFLLSGMVATALLPKEAIKNNNY